MAKKSQTTESETMNENEADDVKMQIPAKPSKVSKFGQFLKSLKK
jgi:hypothetical protein